MIVRDAGDGKGEECGEGEKSREHKEEKNSDVEKIS